MRARGEGDEVVLSIMEHHSNIVPWHFHRERNGVGPEMGAQSMRTAIS
jgi:selenocysteine lyase/cysteine desulfurase